MNPRLLLLFALLPAAASCQITLPKVLSDHMVVERDLPVHVWGKASPGEEVSVTFRGETQNAFADPLGHWSVYLKPGTAGGPFEMAMQELPAGGWGAATPASRMQPTVIHDILVGDIWLASGQSNMEFPLSRAATAGQDIPNAGTTASACSW